MKFQHEAERIVDSLNDMTGDAISSNCPQEVYATYVLGVSLMLTEFIQARERKAFQAASHECKVYFAKEGIVMTVEANFDDYLASPEYLDGGSDDNKRGRP